MSTLKTTKEFYIHFCPEVSQMNLFLESNFHKHACLHRAFVYYQEMFFWRFCVMHAFFPVLSFFPKNCITEYQQVQNVDIKYIVVWEMQKCKWVQIALKRYIFLYP